jgi:hypothetical protein
VADQATPAGYRITITVEDDDGTVIDLGCFDTISIDGASLLPAFALGVRDDFPAGVTPGAYFDRVHRGTRVAAGQRGAYAAARDAYVRLHTGGHSNTTSTDRGEPARARARAPKRRRPRPRTHGPPGSASSAPSARRRASRGAA